jgi:hypothetical protein
MYLIHIGTTVNNFQTKKRKITPETTIITFTVAFKVMPFFLPIYEVIWPKISICQPCEREITTYAKFQCQSAAGSYLASKSNLLFLWN